MERPIAHKCRCGRADYGPVIMPVWPWLEEHTPEGCYRIPDPRPRLIRFQQELVRASRVLQWGAKHVESTLSFLPDEGKESAARWLEAQRMEAKVIGELVRGTP